MFSGVGYVDASDGQFNTVAGDQSNYYNGTPTRGMKSLILVNAKMTTSYSAWIERGRSKPE